MRVLTLALAAIVSMGSASAALADPAPKRLAPSTLNHTVSATLPDSQHVFPPGAGGRHRELAMHDLPFCWNGYASAAIIVWRMEERNQQDAHGLWRANARRS